MSSTIRTPWPSRSAPAELERLPDRRQPERLAGVDRDVEVLPADVLEGVEIAGRRVALLGTGDVEADHALVAPAHRAFGDLDRTRRLAHRRDDGLHDDRVTGRGGLGGADAEPLQVGLNNLVERQPALRRELGRVAHLGVDDAVGGEVLGALGRDADDRVALLHDPDRVGEGLEVELEGLPVGAAPEPGRQLDRIGRRQAPVAVLGRQVDDRRGPEPAVEVVVEEGLRCLADGV